jgi:hypothetical protein
VVSAAWRAGCQLPPTQRRAIAWPFILDGGPGGEMCSCRLPSLLSQECIKRKFKKVGYSFNFHLKGQSYEIFKAL